jgi:hypothetical protein
VLPLTYQFTQIQNFSNHEGLIAVPSHTLWSGACRCSDLWLLVVFKNSWVLQ